MIITASTLTKSFIAFVISFSLPLILNLNKTNSVIISFLGGAATATVANKSVNSNKKKQSILPIDEATTLVNTDSAYSDLSLITPQVPQLESISNSDRLIALLKQKDLTVIKHRQSQEEDELLDPIANYLGKNYSGLQKIHNRIKASISNKTKFSFNLHGKSQLEIQCCTQYCHNLYGATLLSHYYYDKRRKIIYGTVQRRSDIIQFLEGGWFERAIVSQVKDKFDDCKQAEYLVNPHLEFGNGDRFELDILFLIDSQLYWIECKTGNHYKDHLPKYCQHRKVLEIDKKKSFLVCSELSDADAKKLTKLWTITIVNQEGLASKL